MLPTDRFLAFIRQHHLFEPSDKVLLTVSGGRDSVLMTYLFNSASLNFGIAHCNFSLRAHESDEDQEFVKELALGFNVPFFNTRFETEAYAENNHISTQIAARQLRYSWFEKIRKENQYQYIAVAHHQSDATETVLLNLVRGTGISGLHGILPKRGTVIRPLLFLSGTEVRELIALHHLPYREDSSNLSAKYARNKIRLKVIPVLKELNAGLEITFAENSRRFAEIEEFLHNQVLALRKDLFKVTSPDEITIPLHPLKELKPLKLLLFELFRPHDFSETTISDLIRAWGGQPGKIFESSTHTLLLDREQLILKKKLSSETPDVPIFEQSRSVSWKNSTFTCSFSDPGQVHIETDPGIAYFDEGLLQFPLKLRLWRKGDYFYPFGMKGKKKLSDYFTGLKLSLFRKENIPVLENGNGDILWIAGYRSDNRYRITSRTQKVFILEKQNNNEQ